MHASDQPVALDDGQTFRILVGRLLGIVAGDATESVACPKKSQQAFADQAVVIGAGMAIGTAIGEVGRLVPVTSTAGAGAVM